MNENCFNIFSLNLYLLSSTQNLYTWYLKNLSFLYFLLFLDLYYTEIGYFGFYILKDMDIFRKFFPNYWVFWNNLLKVLVFFDIHFKKVKPNISINRSMIFIYVRLIFLWAKASQLFSDTICQVGHKWVSIYIKHTDKKVSFGLIKDFLYSQFLVYNIQFLKDIYYSIIFYEIYFICFFWMIKLVTIVFALKFFPLKKNSLQNFFLFEEMHLLSFKCSAFYFFKYFPV